MTNYNPLWNWIIEREKLRIKKQSGVQSPWTDDPILAKFRFCNVRREDDIGTIWIKQNIRIPFSNSPSLWFMLCIARQINWPPTLAELIQKDAWPYSSPSIADVLNERKARGDKVYTGAYMISAPSIKGTNKQTYISDVVLGELWNNRYQIADLFASGKATLQSVHAWLMQFNGWGPFMAYQAVVDMRFTHLLDKASDIDSWAAAGPGTIRGLNRIHERDTNFVLSQSQALFEMKNIYKIVYAETNVEMDFSDVPNILCETDKWLRVHLGEGKPRALYIHGRGS